MTEKGGPESWSASKLARAAGVSTDTLRHYERKQLIARPPRTASGYRCYPPEMLVRVQLIRRALALGFTLDELAPVLRCRDHGGAPCREVKKLAAKKLKDIEFRIEELLAMKNYLGATLEQWDKRLAGTTTGKRARLLESLGADSRSGGRRSKAFSTNNGRQSER